MSTMESFKSEPQFSPFSPRKPSLFLFFARSCSITLYRTQPIKIELLSYYLTIMVRYRNLVRQIGPSESSELGTGTLSLSHFVTLALSHSLSLNMLNNFCFHVYAQKSLFKVENVNAFFSWVPALETERNRKG